MVDCCGDLVACCVVSVEPRSQVDGNGDNRGRGRSHFRNVKHPCCCSLPYSFPPDERSRPCYIGGIAETQILRIFKFVIFEDDLRFLRRTIELADEAVANGNHPFGSLLVDASGEIIGEGGNEFTIDRGPGHAETNLARRAARSFPLKVLRGATLYTSVEPCMMCAGTIYWAEIGSVVFGMTEKRLAELTDGDDQNPTPDLDCRTVFASGRNTTTVRGPFPELEADIVAQHAAFWNH